MLPGKKMGRPKLDDPAIYTVTVRLSLGTIKRIEEYSVEHEISKGKVIKMAIDKFFGIK